MLLFENKQTQFNFHAMGQKSTMSCSVLFFVFFIAMSHVIKYFLPEAGNIFPTPSAERHSDDFNQDFRVQVWAKIFIHIKLSLDY